MGMISESKFQKHYIVNICNIGRILRCGESFPIFISLLLYSGMRIFNKVEKIIYIGRSYNMGIKMQNVKHHGKELKINEYDVNREYGKLECFTVMQI